MQNKTGTPCIGICSTVLGDDICRGCKRFAHEIIAWNSYSAEQKSLVNCRIEHFLGNIIQGKLVVEDPERLETALGRLQVATGAYESAELRAFCLIRHADFEPSQAAGCGLRFVQTGINNADDVRRLCAIIDHEVFVLAQAHYDRYILPRIPVTGPLE